MDSGSSDGEASSETAEKAFVTVADDLDAARAFLQRQAGERPLLVIGAAVGIGFLLGSLLSRGR